MAARRRMRTGRSRLTEFVNAYIDSALWSSTDESDESGGEPMDKNYGPNDIAPPTRREMFLDAVSFYKANIMDFDDPSQAGHDFWLTRNGHGTGFWDRPTSTYSPAAAKRLTNAAKAYGEYNLYVGDDNQIYGSSGSLRRSRPSRTRRDMSGSRRRTR